MNREIAEAMNIAVRTVEVHRARVMEKMQAGSLAELIRRFENGLARDQNTNNV